MTVIAPTNSATPTVQISLMQSRLESAKREAEQAQVTEQRLRREMQSAESQSQRSQEKVNSLSQQINQFDPTYTARVQKNLQAANTTQTQTWFSGLNNSKQIQTLSDKAGHYLNMSA